MSDDNVILAFKPAELTVWLKPEDAAVFELYDTRAQGQDFQVAASSQKTAAYTVPFVRSAASDAVALDDTARLDWMLNEQCQIQSTIAGARTLYCVHWPEADEWQNAYFDTPRAAIDEARRAANGAAGQEGAA